MSHGSDTQLQAPGGKGPQLLDCTLRDGGYYCDWDFDDRFVQRYVDALAAACVDYVELGFRSPPGRGFAGAYKFTTNDTITALTYGSPLSFAVMIDAKDFVDPSAQVSTEHLKRLFGGAERPASLKLVRVATPVSLLPKALEQVRVLKELGYAVALNLMQASLLPSDELERIASGIKGTGVDVLYFADSFGGMTPSEVRATVRSLRSGFQGMVGIHAHDNIGLALANSLAAIEEQVSFVDATVGGMGRGAGNLKTEQYLLYRRHKLADNTGDLAPLLSLAATEVQALHDQYGWGTNVAYTLSGMHNVHPKYLQSVLERYTMQEVLNIVEAIRATNQGASFDGKVLTKAIRHRHSGTRGVQAVESLRGHRGRPPKAPNEALVVGSGPNLERYTGAIRRFVQKVRPLVLACNDEHLTIEDATMLRVVLNQERLHALLTNEQRSGAPLLLGMSEVPMESAHQLGSRALFSLPCEVSASTVSVEGDKVIIPGDVVGMYAIAAAIALGARRIYLAGFEGYGRRQKDRGLQNPYGGIDRHAEMAEFFRLAQAWIKEKKLSVELISILPTTYPVTIESIYSYV
jgi:4-hydroxy 2-oxovalerate aldolase